MFLYRANTEDIYFALDVARGSGTTHRKRGLPRSEREVSISCRLIADGPRDADLCTTEILSTSSRNLTTADGMCHVPVTIRLVVQA